MERNLMAVTVKEKNNGKVLEVGVHDKLTSDDYKRFIPEFDRLVKQHGKLRVLFEMTDFHGWDAGALWQDMKFETTHFRDIERLAIVGDKKWEKGMSEFCKPFTSAKIQYFDQSQLDQARQWIESN